MDKEIVVDYLIIGAGPAGLQMGYFFEKHQRNYLILEAQNLVASFFAKHPRNRKLISFNKTAHLYDDPEIKLRWDWNSLLSDYEFLFEAYSKKLYPSADEMVHYLSDFANHYELNIQFNTKVAQVSRLAEGGFCVKDASNNEYFCRGLIVATGLSKPYIPDIPGIEHVEEGYENVTMEPESFRNQRVLIIGKGNSGFEIADNILETAALIHLASPESIKFAWNTRHPGHLRADYTRILDAYQLKLLHGALDCTISQIYRENGKYVASIHYTHADGEVEEIIYDRIIRCAGFCFDDAIFDSSCKPALAITGKFPALTSMWESTNVPDLFFAGTLMQMRDFRQSSSAFIDGFRYNIRCLYHFLANRYHDQPLPNQLIPMRVKAIAEATMERVCRTSALWTQFGYLCDVIVVDEETDEIRHFFELPIDYVRESEFMKAPHYYVITFEWGAFRGDVFAIERHPNHETAYTNAFLHPIVRRYSHSTLVAEHHILEDLFGMYSYKRSPGVYKNRSGRSVRQYHYEEHEQPLHQFFASQLR